MALSGNFAAAGTSATITGLVGNCDLQVRMAAGTKNVRVRLEISHDAGTSWSMVKDFKDSDMPVNKVMVAGDGLAVYRLRCMAVTGTVYYYIGQEAAA